MTGEMTRGLDKKIDRQKVDSKSLSLKIAHVFDIDKKIEADR